MGFDLSGVSTFLWSWLTSFVFWGILLVAILIVVFGSLWVRKKRKLIYPAVELTDLGAGKIGFKSMKAGWFKTKSVFFGLYDYGGEDVLRMKDGRIVQNASSEDFHEINGKRGLIVIRKSDDPAILLPVNKVGTSDKYSVEGEEIKKLDKIVPITTMQLTNPRLLLEIASADYRDASSKIVFDAEKETRDKWERLTPILVFGTMAIVFLITIILIVQMVKQGQAESKNLILEAGRIHLENIKAICRGIATTAESIPSTIAP